MREDPSDDLTPPHGLLLDLLATGDQARVQDAAESFLATLGQAQPHGAPGPGEPPGGQR
jgi:hypothetical protein